MLKVPEKWIIIKGESINKYSDVISQTYQGELEGIVVTGVFSQAEMLALKTKLATKKTGFYPTPYGETWGKILVAQGNDKSDYFAAAEKFRAELKEIFPTDFEATIKSIVRQLSGNKAVELPGEQGRAYTPATIRFAYPNHGGIPIHIGNEFLHDSAYNYLKEIAQLVDGLSYFVVVNKAEAGGELILYDLPAERLKKSETDREKIREAKQSIDKFPRKIIVPEIGDLVIFQGGSILHCIADILGNETRITIGGSLALSRDREKVYYWS
ncbi:2OG-Fe(II)-dependent halogenase WelO5 family protein [Oscillatoria salina]|uniref:2OG-Fe(II)-dependent halogenase WelO5 family protein n=1 Tax=Oscillatoria salina TaxID=331517 RepID=UPI0013B85693|nr:hypothetical protein [Oscillatoria salina]MBZ8183319.1 hypothetical protein [Oscillatoria salina IIICB1]NET90281.1 hypothetical protein [Kamptonema sp. SIO1D9]